MLHPTLPTPRKLHEMDRVHVDIAIEASQKRTRTMMAKAAELAIVALDLEKELRWSEALTAYNEVCSYFKRILEVAESKDISDILFVHHKYSKRMAYIRSMTKHQLPKALSTSRYPKLDATGTNSESALSQQPQEETSILNAKRSSPKYGRFRSDSYTNPPTSSPLVSARRPSLASPNISLAQAARRNPTSRNLPADCLSRYDLKPDTLDTSELSRFSRRIASSPNERLIASALGRKEANSLQNNIPTSNHKEVPPPSPKEKQEIRRLLDLKSIPETEENLQSASQAALKPDAKLKGPLLRSKPRILHNPSMPNLFSVAQSQDPGYKSKGPENKRLQEPCDTSTIPFMRAHLISTSTFDFEVSSSPLSSFPPLTSKDVVITTEGTSLSEARDDSAINNTSEDLSLIQDNALPVVGPLPARPSTSFHNRTVPGGLQLSIQTDISLLYSEPNVISPQVLSPSPSRASRTLFQVLWREEIQSKPSWTPPPSIGLLRPLWHLSCIKQSITVGGFIGTKRLFIQPGIWRQQGLKLLGLDVKIQTLAYLQDYLCRLKEHWVEDVLGLTQGLEDLDALTLNTHQALASKFSFVPPLKRSQNSATTALFSFASKISKSVERLQSNYSKDKVEGISAYLDLLVKFIDACGFIESWYIRFASKAITDTAYAPLLARIQRFLEFLNSVILTFVLNDLNTCLVKHLKRTRELANE